MKRSTPELKPVGTYPQMSREIRRNVFPRTITVVDKNGKRQKKTIHGESQDELLTAVPSLVNRNNVYAFEHGRKDIRISQAIDVANHYNCTLDALFSREISGYGQITNNQIQMYEISPVTNNTFSIAHSWKGKDYNFREKIRANATIIAFRLREGVSTLGLKKDDVLLVDTDWTRYINTKMYKKFTVIMKNESARRDVDFDYYYITEMETVYDYANIKASRAVVYVNQDGKKTIREITELEDEELMYGVVFESIRYY